MSKAFFAIRATNGTYRGVLPINEKKQGKLPFWEYQISDAERFKRRVKAEKIARQIQGAIVVQVQLIDEKWEEVK